MLVQYCGVVLYLQDGRVGAALAGPDVADHSASGNLSLIELKAASPRASTTQTYTQTHSQIQFLLYVGFFSLPKAQSDTAFCLTGCDIAQLFHCQMGKLLCYSGFPLNKGSCYNGIHILIHVGLASTSP